MIVALLLFCSLATVESMFQAVGLDDADDVTLDEFQLLWKNQSEGAIVTSPFPLMLLVREVGATNLSSLLFSSFHLSLSSLGRWSFELNSGGLLSEPDTLLGSFASVGIAVGGGLMGAASAAVGGAASFWVDAGEAPRGKPISDKAYRNVYDIAGEVGSGAYSKVPFGVFHFLSSASVNRPMPSGVLGGEAGGRRR